jgi:hypothetical protein
VGLSDARKQQHLVEKTKNCARASKLPVNQAASSQLTPSGMFCAVFLGTQRKFLTSGVVEASKPQ